MTTSSDEPGPTMSSCFDRIEDAWCAGERPNLRDFLPLDPRTRRELLPELVKLDLDLSWKTETPRYVKGYFLEFPELLADADAATRLIRLEMERRAYSGPVTLDEYRDRYPQLADDLTSFALGLGSRNVAARGPAPPRPNSEIARRLNALLDVPPPDPSTASRGVVVPDEARAEGSAPPPTPRRGRVRRIGFSMAMAASICLALVIGRGFAPKPAVLTVVGLEMAPSQSLGGSTGSDAHIPEDVFAQNPAENAIAVRNDAPYSIVIRSHFSGFATVIRVSGGGVTVLPREDGQPIRVEAGRPLAYGPLVDPPGGVSLRVYVTPAASSTSVVRRVVAGFSKTRSATAETLFPRIEEALVASGERKITIAGLKMDSRPPNESSDDPGPR